MEAFPPQEQQAVETPHLEIEEQGFIARASEFARDHMPRKLTAGLAVAALAVSGGVELSTAEADIAPALPDPGYKLTFKQCAWRATHLVPHTMKSKLFGVNGSSDNKFVRVQGETNELTGCDGQSTWRVQIRKEDKKGYYDATNKIVVASGNTGKKVDKILKTKGNLTCDGGIGGPTYDAYQNNYFSYKSPEGTATRKVKSPVKPAYRYC